MDLSNILVNAYVDIITSPVDILVGAHPKLTKLALLLTNSSNSALASSVYTPLHDTVSPSY